jgi:Legionella pneumophila major outer membrane protein precursor
MRYEPYPAFIAAFVLVCEPVINFAQAQDLPPAPLPVVVEPVDAQPSGTATMPSGPTLVQQPLPVYPPPSIAPYEEWNRPPLQGDPLSGRSEGDAVGWFVAIETDVVGSHLNNRLIGPVAFSGFTEVIQLPSGQLDWTASPRVEVGYRLPDGCGAIVLVYRSLVAEGGGSLPGFDLDGSDGVLFSRLNVNTLDLDYASHEYALAPCWDMRWKAGARVGGVFFDSTGFGQFREEHASNNFVGAGPHVGLDLSRRFGASGLALFGRLDFAALIGDIHQSFEEEFIAPNGTLLGAASRVSQAQVVPDLHFQAGISWSPGGLYRSLHLSGGYEIENWWYLGQVGGSRAELTSQGIFLRAGWDF